jgi:hypothetical protein
MSLPHSTPRVQQRLRTRFGSALAALGTLAAIAIAILILAPTSANHTGRPNSTTRAHPTPALTAPTHYNRTNGCHAALDPLLGVMHGGCAR